MTASLCLIVGFAGGFFLACLLAGARVNRLERMLLKVSAENDYHKKLAEDLEADSARWVLSDGELEELYRRGDDDVRRVQ